MQRFKLRGTIRHKTVRYAPGSEKELLSVLSAEETQSFIERGHLVEVEPEGFAVGGDAEVESLAAEISGTYGIARSSEEAPKEFILRVVEAVGEAASMLNSLTAQRDEAKNELVGIDAILARRTALDALPDRTSKIEAACQAAQAGDSAQIALSLEQEKFQRLESQYAEEVAKGQQLTEVITDLTRQRDETAGKLKTAEAEIEKLKKKPAASGS
jgi:chromosome segregation ATPase